MLRLAAAATAAGAFGYLCAPRLVRLFKKKTSTVEVLYFNIPGLGEPIRFLLSYLKVPFKDNRFPDREAFLKIKPTLKYGQVPVLKVNGVELFQSTAIFRFIAQTFDASGTLYPASPVLAARVDAICDQIKDMMQGWGPIRYRERFGFGEANFSNDAAAKCQATFLTEVMPRHFGFFKTQLEEDPASPWLLGGSSPTIADFALACQLRGFLDKDFDGIKVEVPPCLRAHADAIYALPAIAAFRAAQAPQPQPQPAPAGAPLNAFAAAVAAATPAMQKQMIGEKLFPAIAKLQPELAGKITGMMLEKDNSELLALLDSDIQLRQKVDEAICGLETKK